MESGTTEGAAGETTEQAERVAGETTVDSVGGTTEQSGAAVDSAEGSTDTSTEQTRATRDSPDDTTEQPPATDDTTHTSTDQPRATWSWRRGRVLAVVAAILAFLIAGHALVPNAIGHLGSFLETFLPWLGLGIPVLLILARVRRSTIAMIAVLLPVVAWIAVFGARSIPGEDGDIIAVQHNVSDENADPTATARALTAPRPDLIALEELLPGAVPEYEAVLHPAYPYHALTGTVGLWSKYALTDIRPVDIRPADIAPGWNRGLRATASTPWGPIAVYVAHLPSLRMAWNGFGSDRRDESARMLGDAIAADPAERLILLGDLNSTVDDRGISPISDQMETPGPGFAFSWPAAAPLARVDQILTRSAPISDVRTLPRTGSDHLPVLAEIMLGEVL